MIDRLIFLSVPQLADWLEVIRSIIVHLNCVGGSLCSPTQNGCKWVCWVRHSAPYVSGIGLCSAYHKELTDLNKKPHPRQTALSGPLLVLMRTAASLRNTDRGPVCVRVLPAPRKTNSVLFLYSLTNTKNNSDLWEIQIYCFFFFFPPVASFSNEHSSACSIHPLDREWSRFGP